MQHLTTEGMRDRVNVIQGTNFVTADPKIVLTTVLGSCVACCLFDPHAKVGGMNHFLLAQPREGMRSDNTEAERYGLFAMELLVNEMLKAGATRSTLRAHLYGGANMHAGMQAIGTSNARFAEDFLARDRIPLAHRDLGGTQARRVEFRAAMGQARCRLVEAEVPIEVRRPAVVQDQGEVELF
jgi:chemotaxis protein CheD